MMRRALLFAPAAAAAHEPLLLQGTATWRYLGLGVYEASLYLPRRVAQAELAADPSEIRVHYLRPVALDDVRRAWAASLPWLEPGFDAWLRPLAAGAIESYQFADGGVVLSGPGRPMLTLPAGPFAAALRASWLGPQAPAALLRGWFAAS